MEKEIFLAGYPGHDSQNDATRLITNPQHFLDQIEPMMVRLAGEVPDIILRTHQYLHSVLEGNGQRPDCPFVKKIEELNGYYIQTIAGTPSLELLNASIVPRLIEEFFIHSPFTTRADQDLDPTSLVLAFSDPLANTEGYCTNILDVIRNVSRLAFLEAGLMVSQMHPFHPRAQGRKGIDVSGKYQAGVPLLVVRRMHKPDHVFMRTDDERAAYQKFFGKLLSSE
jgi:hypothetical protein